MKQVVQTLCQPRERLVYVQNLPQHILTQQDQFPEIRQTVLVPVYNTSIRKFLVIKDDRSVADGRYNLNPVQGGVHYMENPFDAATRELQEEAGLSAYPTERDYVGSMLCKVNPNRQQGKQEYQFQNYHVIWVNVDTTHVHSEESGCQPAWLHYSAVRSCVLKLASRTKQLLLAQAFHNAQQRKLIGHNDWLRRAA